MKRKGWKIDKMIFLSGILIFCLPIFSFSQDFPTKPVNILVGFAPGIPTEVSIRLLAKNAEKFLGQPFVISNNGGGGGAVALGIVAKQKPDGYHLFGGTSTPLVRIPQFRPVAYKPEEFIPIMHLGAPESGLAVRADSPWKTLKDLVEYARKNPGKIAYTSTGTGLPMHLAMEYIAKQEGGIQWTHVPSGDRDPILALLGGSVSACSTGTQWIPHVKAGTLRALVTYGEKRLKTFPEIPILRELGYDFINETVILLAAPQGTPPSIVKKLDDAFRKAMDAPEFVDYMEKMEYAITYRNHGDIKRYLEDAYARIGKMIQELKIPREEKK
jgi:tripartite-type tricarboxylate transporter receptor subunit TctC